MSDVIHSNEQPVSAAACKRVVDFVQREYFIRLEDSDPLIIAVVRDPDIGLRALIAAKKKAPPEARIAKQIGTIAAALRSVLDAEASPGHLFLEGRRTLECLAPMADVTWSREVSDPDGLLFCIMQYHGDPNEMRLWQRLGRHDKIREWFAHQTETLAIASTIDQGAKDGSHCLIECINQESIDSGATVSDAGKQAIAHRHAIFERVAKDVDAGAFLETNPGLLQWPHFSALQGMIRWMEKMGVRGQESLRKCAGLISDRHVELVGKKERATTTDDYAKAFTEAAEDVNRTVHDRLAAVPKGATTMLFLGGAHFYDQQRYDKELHMLPQYHPDYPKLRTDHFIANQEQFQRMNIYTLLPRAFDRIGPGIDLRSQPHQ